MNRVWGIAVATALLAGCVTNNGMIRRDTSGRYFQLLVANVVGMEFDQFDATACEQQLRGIKSDEQKPGVTFRCSPSSSASELPFQLSMRDKIVGADISARARTLEGCNLLLQQLPNESEMRKNFSVGTSCFNANESAYPKKSPERENATGTSAPAIATKSTSAASIEPTRQPIAQPVATTSLSTPSPTRNPVSTPVAKPDSSQDNAQRSVLAVSVGDTLVAFVHSSERNNCAATLQTMRQRIGDKFSLKCQSEKPSASALPVLLHFLMERNVVEVRNINAAYCRYIKEALSASQPLIDCEENRK
jgi:hypothetical protein